MRITLDVGDERVADLLQCALQGSHYWARFDSDYNAADVVAGTGKWRVVDTLDKPVTKSYLLDSVAVKQGLVRMAKQCPYQFGQWLNAREDSETGDVFLQCCIFGAVVYG